MSLAAMQSNSRLPEQYIALSRTHRGVAAAAIFILAFSAPEAFAFTWCWKEGLVDVVQGSPEIGCPVGLHEVQPCGVELPSGKKQIVLMPLECPKRADYVESQPPLDWRTRPPYDASSPKVVLLAGIAQKTEVAPPPPDRNDSVTPVDSWRPIQVVNTEATSDQPSNFSRHFGKFVGTMGIFALVAIAVAIFRFISDRSKAAAGAPAVRQEVASSAVAVSTGNKNGTPEGAGVAPSPQDAHYVQALDELDAGKPHRATWARALASSGGVDALARADYIKLRVAQLAAS